MRHCTLRSMTHRILLHVFTAMSLSACPSVLNSEQQTAGRELPKVYFSDSSRLGRPFAKDPSVIKLHDRYFLYYTLPPASSTAESAGEASGWGIGIAESKDLVNWVKVGELPPSAGIESKGIAAP